MTNEEFENLLQQEKEKAYQKGSQDKMLDVMVLMIEDSCYNYQIMKYLELDKETFDKYVQFLRDEKRIKTKEELMQEYLERVKQDAYEEGVLEVKLNIIRGLLKKQVDEETIMYLVDVTKEKYDYILERLSEEDFDDELQV